MRISQKGIDLIKSFEGCILHTYKCPAGVYTIGYGSTGQFVKPGMTISLKQAESLLRVDLNRFEVAVNGLVQVPLTQAQYDALISLAFNIGVGAFTQSTLLRKLNTGDYEGAANEFLRWTRGGGKILGALVKRRKRERELFNNGE